ncbi:MAG TPA: NADH-quinone oxidoreductase subunit H, partial [Ktedonobacteraceae bacterium]|nr:NADH-quinone oxidoreductase subunit H [Ktedonobacteraceae bacterium]
GFLTASGMAFGWQLLGNILGIGYFITKVYLLCFVFIWVRSTLPRLRADQLMQFTWLILIPVTLGNIVITALIFLILNSLGLSNLIFLIVLGIVNFIMLGGFIMVISRATVATTHHAQAPAILAQRRAAEAQLPEHAGVGGGQK